MADYDDDAVTKTPDSGVDAKGDAALASPSGEGYAASAAHPASWAAEFEVFLTNELPSRLRARLERDIERELRVTDDRLKQRAVGLVKGLALEAFREFAAVKSSELAGDVTVEGPLYDGVSSPSDVFESAWDATPTKAETSDDDDERGERAATPRAQSSQSYPSSTGPAHHYRQVTGAVDTDQLPPPPPPLPHYQTQLQNQQPNWIDMLDPLSFAGYDTECDLDFDFGQDLSGNTIQQRRDHQHGQAAAPPVDFTFRLRGSDGSSEEEQDITAVLQMQKYFDSGYESSGEDWGRW